MTTIARRILLVENDPDLLRAVARRLRVAGYTVASAATVEAAQTILAQEVIHLAIIDIRVTNDRSETDRSGFALARALPAYIPFLFHTAHDTKEHIREALREIGAEDIIAKDERDAPAKLLGRVQAMFAESVALNFELVITGQVDLDQLAAQLGHDTHVGANIGINDEPAITTPNPTIFSQPKGEDIDLLLRRLLPKALTVDLAPLLSSDVQHSHSHSGAVLLRLHEQRQEGQPVPMVLKVGQAAMIRDEAERYRLLQPYLGGQRLAHLEGEAYSRQTGGLLYTLVGAQDWEALDVLAVHLAHGDLQPLERLISRFLTQTFQAIYQQAQEAPLDLTTHYTAALGLTVEKLHQALASWQPDAQSAQTLTLPGFTTPLPNPVAWAIVGGNFRTWGPVTTRTVLCHGDLHCRNILVDSEGNGWLIDFGRAGRSHYLRDFAELETDLRLQLAAGAAPRDLLPFEEALTQNPWGQSTIAPPALSPTLARTYALICTVRRSARELIVGELREVEYQQALFWHLLNAVRLRALTQEKKAYALFAAGTVIEALEER